MSSTGTSSPTGSPTSGPTPDAVQSPGRRRDDLPRRPTESLAVFVAFAVLYTVVGHWLVVEQHVVGFDTLERFARGLTLLHGDPSVAGVLGSDHAPLAVLLVSPLTAVPAWAASLSVVPVGSALFAALTMVALNTVLRRARVTAPLRLAVLAALGLNPLVVLHASVGGSTFVWLAFAVLALGALVAWHITADVRFVMAAALAFAVASLAGYGSLPWFLVSLVAVVVTLVRLGAGGTEVEGTGVALASPTVYVVALWAAVNVLALSSPFGWLDTTSSDAVRFSLLDLVTSTGELVLYGAPVALVVLPALVIVGLTQRNEFALWLGVLLAVSIVAPAVSAAARLSDTPMAMSNAVPVLLVSVVGAVWLARSSGTRRGLVAGVLVAGLLASIPWTFSAMASYRHQGLEEAFHDTLATGVTQEGTTTVDGAVVGYADEQAMADWIVENVDRPASILTDDSQTYAVVLLTGEPALFVADATSSAAAADPAAHVDYLLLSTDATRDLLSRRYPDAATSTDPRFPVATETDRYVLVEVPDDAVDAVADGIVEEPPSEGESSP